MKVSGDPQVFISKEHPAGKIAGKADPLQGELRSGNTLHGTKDLGQTKPEIQSNPPVKQMPQGALLEKAEANLLSQLKLPPDSLSRSIIAFARFFSLPLEPKLLAALRRGALGVKASGREAAALGAAAAADKGINLSEKALAEYAAAIDGKDFAPEEPAAVPVNAHKPQNEGENNDSPPEDRQSDDTAEREAGQGTGNGESGPESDGFGAENGSRNNGSQSNGGGSRDGGNLRDDDGPELQRRITEILGEAPFLDLINRIPGKNGRWIVLPFSFSEDGLDFAVSLRILLPKEMGKSLVYGRLTADIKVTRLGQEQKRWLITLERTPELSAELSVFSGSDPWHFSAAEKNQAKRELAAVLDIPPDRVSIREDALPFADSRERALRSINEEV